MPDFFRGPLIEANRGGYFLRLHALDDADEEPAASVLLLAACDDGQTTRDGVFTSMVLNVLDGGRFPGTYDDLLAELRRRLDPPQLPQLFAIGRVPSFRDTRVFSL